jgi:hypothetical protein
MHSFIYFIISTKNYFDKKACTHEDILNNLDFISLSVVRHYDELWSIKTSEEQRKENFKVKK